MSFVPIKGVVQEDDRVLYVYFVNKNGVDSRHFSVLILSYFIVE